MHEQNNHWNERLELKLILTSSVNTTRPLLLLKANKQVTLKVNNICFYCTKVLSSFNTKELAPRNEISDTNQSILTAPLRTISQQLNN